jgi:hypothetical protein
MKPTLNEKFIAYLALLSGLSISAVAVYYSVVGLTAIFAAAVIPIIIMGTTLEVSKLVATVWLKQNWKTAPILIKTYLFTAIVVLMIVTSMGIFGFLSKAHSDQNLVSGDVLAKISVYDEKIKTSKENIDANRKALKQLDEAVDQVMARSDSEKGADKAVAIRKTQSKERTRLQSEITTEQERIAQLNEERAPIAAEVRKVEAEVGPIKYIAAFFYGSTDETILEKAVTWVIITLIVVFDPLAVILLLASQISFQEFRERNKEIVEGDSPRETTVVVDTEPLTVTEQEEVPESVFDHVPMPISTITNWIYKPVEDEPQGTEFEPINCSKCGTELVDAPGIGLYCPNEDCGVLDDWDLEEPDYEQDDGALTDEQIEQIKEIAKQYIPAETVEEPIAVIAEEPSGYIQNEEQAESGVWTNTITKTEYAEVSDTEEHRRDVLINQWANLVRTRRAKMSDVPQHLVLDVRSRV